VVNCLAVVDLLRVVLLKKCTQMMMSNDGVGMMQTNVGSFRGGLLQMNLRKSLVYFLLSSLSVITRIQGTNGVLCLWVILILQTMQQ
jgi:hypothetical protein